MAGQIFGLEDVALLLPAVVGPNGASVVLEPHADVLSEAIETVSGA